VILLLGIPSEPPLALVQERLLALGAPTLVLNQRQFESVDLWFEVAGRRVDGWLRLDGRHIPLAEIEGVYARPMDDRLLPELEGEPQGSPRRLRCRRLHEALVAWLDVAPGRVVNRFREMGSNGSKPYQAQLIREAGFSVPETLVTNDPAAVERFRRRHGRIIYKSVSATRSIVQELTGGDEPRLEAVRACPVQFQAYVPGFDVRVHVVGEEVIATRIDSAAVDYRYSEHGEGGTRLTAIDLPAELAARSRRLTQRLGLSFAGIDLRFTPAGDVVCFEVNPSPAYSYYEEHAGQPISMALARYLVDGRGPAQVASPSVRRRRPGSGAP
jgi:hypothetical protein